MSDVYEIGPKPQLDALGYLQSVYRDATQPATVRMKAAIEALQFERPKLSAVANLNSAGLEFATELEQRRSKRPRLVENGRQVGSGEERTEPTEAETVSAEHLKKGFQTLRRRPL